MSERASLTPAQAWQSLLASRGLRQPTGHALYTYRFERAEFEGVRDVLKMCGVRGFDRSPAPALFVMYVAEWFRRSRSGGAWDWIRPLAELGIRYHSTDARADLRYCDVRAAVTEGLRAWRRPVSGPARLTDVVAEAGFPAASAADTSMRRWLQHAVLAAERGALPAVAVEAEAWRAPITIARVVTPAAIQLCAAVLDLRTRIGGAPSAADALQRLDETDPEWRERLPFSVEDKDLASLVEALVTVKDAEGSALSVARKMRRVEGAWETRCTLLLAGAFRETEAPETLRSELRDVARVRIAPAGDRVWSGRPVAVLERLNGYDNAEGWEARPLVREFDVPLGLSDELRLRTVSAARGAVDFLPSGGSALTEPVVVLTSEAADPASADELSVVGCSPSRTRGPWIYLAVLTDDVARLSCDTPPSDLGSCDEGRRRLLAVSGRATMAIGHESLVWNSRAEREDVPTLSLVGDLVRGVRETVFLGAPRAWKSQGDHQVPVSASELLWRAVGGTGWRTASAAVPRGDVEFGVRNRDGWTHFARARIVPRGLRLKPGRGARALLVEGVDGALVSSRCVAPLRVTSENGVAQIQLEDAPLGGLLEVDLAWETRVRMTLRDPTVSPLLLDPSGHIVRERPRIALSSLSGWRVFAPRPTELCREARCGSASPAFSSAVVEGEVPLAMLEADLRDLLGTFGDLDAAVRLSWKGEGGWFAEVSWYDRDEPLFVAGAQTSPFEVLSRLDDRNIEALSLVDPARGVTADVPRTGASLVRQRLRGALGAGPWLVFGRGGDGGALRPHVLSDDGAHGVAEDRLTLASRAETRPAREHRFREALAAQDAPRAVYATRVADLLVQAREHEVALPALDLARALSATPSAAADALACATTGERRLAVLDLQRDFPFLWCLLPMSVWFPAWDLARHDRVERWTALGLSAADADHAVLMSMAQTAEAEPTLSGHVRIAALRSGLAISADATLASRLGSAPRADVAEAARALVTRRADDLETSSTPATLPRWAADRTAAWANFDPRHHDTLAAPWVAAKVAAGRVVAPPALTVALRRTWLRDRDYFEAVFPAALFGEATSPPVLGALA